MTETLTHKLRTGTSHEHRKIEQTPFMRALASGTLPVAAYVAQLRGYILLHAALDGRAARATDPAIRAVWRDDLIKAPLLEADLAHFGRARPASLAELDATARAIDELDEASALPPRLLGWLYVTEGSTLGGAFLRPIVARAYGLEGDHGTRYYAPYGTAAGQHWAGVKQRLDAAVQPADHDAVVAEACRAFRAISSVCSAIAIDEEFHQQYALAAE